jgi:hypothetical protein
MNIEYSYFWLPKAGNDENACEDAFFPHNFPFDVILQNERFKRYAIADGASTAYLSGMWATTLVDCFGSYDGDITNSNFFDLLQSIILDDNWNLRLIDFIKKREEEGKPLTWYDEMALQNGAASTFLEISFPIENNQVKNAFSALAIGDSCLFQIRSNELITQFPLNCSADFNNSPVLISSISRRNDDLKERIAYIETGDVLKDDRFFLMTDALASFFFQEYEKGEKPWSLIDDNITDKYRFADWIENLRETKQIRNDDVTLIILQIRED